jgi:peptide/nickel transport system substrate-binding protein
VGCGPFRFVRHVPGEEVVLEANADYWDGRPKLDRLVLRILPDQRTALQSLLAGDLDLMVATWDLLRDAHDADPDGRLASLVYYRTSVWIIRWNQEPSNPLFTDPGVRRALMHALDREQFVERMLGGLGRVAATTYHPDLPWTDRDLAPLPYDPRMAERLLDEAGWRRPRAGAPRERDGRVFRFNLLTAASTQPIVDHTAAWLQQSWSEIGVEAEIEKLDWSEFYVRVHDGRYEAAMSGLSTTPSPDQFELYHSTAREDGVNSMAFADPQVDELLELGRTTFDPAERRAIYHRLQRRLLELQPVGCLVHFGTVVLFDRRLQGIEPSPLDYWRTTRGPRLWSWSEGS